MVLTATVESHLDDILRSQLHSSCLQHSTICSPHKKSYSPLLLPSSGVHITTNRPLGRQGLADGPPILTPLALAL
jgi:hypothetical protein